MSSTHRQLTPDSPGGRAGPAARARQCGARAASRRVALGAVLALVAATAVEARRPQETLWVVREAPAIPATALHLGPSTSEPVLRELSPGEVVSELGCVTQDDVTWCRVALRSDRKVRGWLPRSSVRDATEADLRRRREGASTSAKALVPSPPPVQQTLPYDTQGELPCSSPRDAVDEACAFRLLHDSRGTTLLLASPGADDGHHLHVLRYAGGRFRSRDGRFTYAAETRDGMAWRVSVGNRDHYLIDHLLLRDAPDRRAQATSTIDARQDADRSN